jgi:spermidine synthase
MNNKQSLYSIYFITLILSTCSILYELLIAQAVVSLTANMVVFYSLTIGFYLISMGAGAFYFYKSYKSQNLWAYLFRVEILLAVLGAFAVFVIYAGHMMLGFLKNHFHLFSGSFIFWGLALMMIVFIGFLTGIEMPLLLKIGKDSTSLRITNRLLAFDYFGSLAGGMRFPLSLLPYFELLEIGIIVSFVNLLVAFFILFSLKDHRIGWAQKIIQIFLIAFFVVVFLNAKNLQQFFLKKYYYGETSNSFISLFSSVKELPNVIKLCIKILILFKFRPWNRLIESF